MSDDAPLLLQWDGEVFRPHRRHYKRLDAEFVIGALYTMTLHHERSSESHRHMFAVINEAWKSIPDELADQFPTAERLRKKAMIEAGFYTETLIDCGSKAAALRMAAAVPGLDEFAHAVVRGSFICIRRAKSMRRGAMDGREFQECKQKTLDVIADLIGVPLEQLSKQGEAA